MKTKILGLATLSLLFVAASCTNETSESPNDTKQFTFKTVLGKQTVSRAKEFTNSSWVNGNTMNVYSYQVGNTTEFYTFPLKYDGGSWGYTDTKMSTGVVLRYYAWYPTANVTYVPATGLTATSLSFDYTIQAEAAQEDLIAAPQITSDPSVTLPFSHILSQVNFGLVKSFGMTIEVANIKVNGVKNKGTYTFGSNWSSQEGSANYAYTPQAGTDKTDGQGTGLVYMGNGGSDFTYDNALMLMPQTFASSTDGTISFDFKLTTKDAGNETVYLAGSENAYAQATANLCGFDTKTWVPGKRYLYMFDFNGYLGEQQAITFTVTVSDWLDDDDNTVAETLEVADDQKETIETAISRHSAANDTNGGLKTFPITITKSIGTPIVIENISGFDAGDQIRIEFKTEEDAAKMSIHIDLEATWEQGLYGRICTLTKKPVTP